MCTRCVLYRGLCTTTPLPVARSLLAIYLIYTYNHRKVKKNTPFKGMDLYMIPNCVKTLWTPEELQPHQVSKSNCMFSFLFLIANHIFNCFTKPSVKNI